MKKYTLTALIAFAAGFTVSLLYTPKPLELVYHADDEMPGLTDQAHPDTAILWYTTQHGVNIRNIKDRRGL